MPVRRRQLPRRPRAPAQRTGAQGRPQPANRKRQRQAQTPASDGRRRRRRLQQEAQDRGPEERQEGRPVRLGPGQSRPRPGERRGVRDRQGEGGEKSLGSVPAAAEQDAGEGQDDDGQVQEPHDQEGGCRGRDGRGGETEEPGQYHPRGFEERQAECCEDRQGGEEQGRGREEHPRYRGGVGAALAGGPTRRDGIGGKGVQISIACSFSFIGNDYQLLSVLSGCSTRTVSTGILASLSCNSIGGVVWKGNHKYSPTYRLIALCATFEGPASGYLRERDHGIYSYT